MISVRTPRETIALNDADDDLQRDLEVEITVQAAGGETTDDLLDDIAVEIETRITAASGAPWDSTILVHPTSSDLSESDAGETTLYALRMSYRVLIIRPGPSLLAQTGASAFSAAFSEAFA